MEIKDGKAAIGLGEVSFRKIDRNTALEGIGEDGGVEAVAFEAGDLRDARLGSEGGFRIISIFRQGFFCDEETGD